MRTHPPGPQPPCHVTSGAAESHCTTTIDTVTRVAKLPDDASLRAEGVREATPSSERSPHAAYCVGCGMYLTFTLLMVPVNLNGAFSR
jgi:hypothetical protein